MAIIQAKNIKKWTGTEWKDFKVFDGTNWRDNYKIYAADGNWYEKNTNVYHKIFFKPQANDTAYRYVTIRDTFSEAREATSATNCGGNSSTVVTAYIYQKYRIDRVVRLVDLSGVGNITNARLVVNATANSLIDHLYAYALFPNKVTQFDCDDYNDADTLFGYGAVVSGTQVTINFTQAGINYINYYKDFASSSLPGHIALFFRTGQDVNNIVPTGYEEFAISDTSYIEVNY